MTNQCALCLKSTTLCDSHIIPEFCYKPTYDSKHRGQLLSAKTMKKVYVQKGLREHLLCKDCEQVLSRYEQYFKEFWFDNDALPSSVSSSLIQVGNVDYERFKLFHLSILWRCSISSRKEFSSVDLGPYAEKLRKAILSGDAGPEEHYPLFGRVIVHDDNSIAKGLVSGPSRARLDKSTVYYMCYAGCEWTFIVTDHGGKKYEELAVARNSPLTLVASSIAEINSIRIFVGERNGSV